jgi:hypothetical protein
MLYFHICRYVRVVDIALPRLPRGSVHTGNTVIVKRLPFIAGSARWQYRLRHCSGWA